MKKIFLDIGFDYDFVLYGIVSQETPHRLAWLINDKVKSNFIRKDDLLIYINETEEINITRFYFHDELNHLDFELLSNKDGSVFWLPELRKIDYFILVKGALESFKKRKYTEPFKKIDSIQIITEINHKKLKEKERLIF
ncbi:MAG: IPExxxVDY family protein [Bacteroidota bacterium]